MIGVEDRGSEAMTYDVRDSEDGTSEGRGIEVEGSEIGESELTCASTGDSVTMVSEVNGVEEGV